MGGKSGSKQFATDYQLTIEYGWCLGPVDRFNSIFVGEKFATNGTAENAGEVKVNLPDHFGGQGKEGGIRGRIFFYMGALGQTLSEWLAGRLGRTSATISGDGGIATTWFAHTLQDPIYNPYGYVGFMWGTNNPFIPAVWAEIARAPKVLDPDLAMIPRADFTVASSQVLDISAEPGGGGAAHTAADAISQDVGVLLSGFSPYDVIRITEPEGETWVAWSPWGIPNYTGDPESGSGNQVWVISDEDAGRTQNYGTAGPNGPNETWNGYEEARANFGEFTFTGGSTYRFFIKDNPIGDNSGGVSVKVDRLSGLDANPSHIIYELLTDAQFGLGLAPMLIDLPAFEALAQLMVDEIFGLSFKWKREKGVDSVVNEVLNHVDAVFFPDPESGLLSIKAIRGDYDPASLAVLDDDNFTANIFNRVGLGEMINQVIVTYTDPVTEIEATVPAAQDLGLIAAQGDLISDSRNYYMVRSADKAQDLAFRDLRIAASPLATIEGVVNRSEWNIKPGDVRKITSAKLGITDLIVRIFEVDYGKPGSDGIKLVMIEDIFAQPTQAFDAPPPTSSTPEAEVPTPIDLVQIETLPYYLLVQFLPPEVLQDLVRPDVFAGVLAAEAGQDTSQFDLLSEEVDALGALIYEPVSRMAVMQRGTLRDTMTAANSTAGVVIEDPSQGAAAIVGSLVFIGAGTEAEIEIGIVTAVALDPLEVLPAEITIQRGILDTVPRDWPAGTPVFTINTNAVFIDTNARTGLATVDYKLLSITSVGILPEDQAPVESKVLTERPWLPSRPANVQVNGQGFDTVNVVSLNPIPVTWARRNRLTEDAQILQWSDGDVTPEVGQEVTVSAYDAAGALLGAFPGQTGTSYNLDPVIFGAETMGFIGVKATLGADESLQEYRLPVILSAGWNLNWGFSWDD